MQAKKHTFNYYGNCVGWPKSEVDYLIEMVDMAASITRATFLKHVDREELRDMEKQMGYDTLPWERGGLRMKDDWAVSYHRSKLKGKTVYYFKHSGIEYVFTE